MAVTEPGCPGTGFSPGWRSRPVTTQLQLLYEIGVDQDTVTGPKLKQQEQPKSEIQVAKRRETVFQSPVIRNTHTETAATKHPD